MSTNSDDVFLVIPRLFTNTRLERMVPWFGSFSHYSATLSSIQKEFTHIGDTAICTTRFEKLRIPYIRTLFIHACVSHRQCIKKKRSCVIYTRGRTPSSTLGYTYERARYVESQYALRDPKLLSTINNRRVQFVQLYSLNETLQEATNFLIEYCTGIVSCTYGQR